MRYTVVEGCLTAEVGDATVVLLPSLEYVEIDEVGAAIFDAVGRKGTVEAAVAELLDTFEVEPAELTRDVQDFVERLVDHGALRRSADV